MGPWDPIKYFQIPLACFPSSEQLLGRSIDLNSLLCQRLGSSMLKAIDLAVAKFESSDLCGIVVSSVYLILLFQMFAGFHRGGGGGNRGKSSPPPKKKILAVLLIITLKPCSIIHLQNLMLKFQHRCRIVSWLPKPTRFNLREAKFYGGACPQIPLKRHDLHEFFFAHICLLSQKASHPRVKSCMNPGLCRPE